MLPHVIKVLEQRTPPPKLDKLANNWKELVQMSRDQMCRQYPLWDKNDQVYRGERCIDEADKKALARNEPAKVIVPLSYSQVQTFVAFCSTLYTQRDYFYELSGSGPEDEKPAQLCQAVVERDLDYNKFKGVLLTQKLTDIGRYGLGIVKTSWERKTCPKIIQVPDPAWQPNPALPLQTAPPMIEQMQDVTEYLGNKIISVSPYRWFPDTRLPLTRYREGEFCADEIEMSKGELTKYEQAGQVVGVQFVPPASTQMFQDRRSTILNTSILATDPGLSERYVLITELQIRLNPAKTEIDEGVFLDPRMDAEVLYVVWLGNDNRVLRIEEAGYNHNEFGYDAAQFFNDQNRIVNFGLSELLGPSQDVLDWLMNSHITSVRKVIQNQLVVDPRYVEMQDLISRNPVLRLKSTAQGLSIDSYIKQLQVTDVTSGNIVDMQNVAGFAKEATGISENLLGQFSSGRRSASEARNVNNNAAARLVLIAQGIWDCSLLPLGRKLVSNIRQGLDEDQLVRVAGLGKVMEDPMAVQAFLPVNRDMLYGNYDFLIFNATLPSQRMAQAAVLQELLVAGSKDPRIWFILQMDPRLVGLKWLELMGIRNVQQFQLTPQRLAELTIMAGLGAVSAGPNGTGSAGPGNGPPGQPPTPGSNGQSQPPNGSGRSPSPVGASSRN